MKFVAKSGYKIIGLETTKQSVSSSPSINNPLDEAIVCTNQQSKNWKDAEITVTVAKIYDRTAEKTVNLNFERSASDSAGASATISWNGSAVSTSSASRSGLTSYRTLDSTFYDGDNSGDFANSISLTPSANNVVVRWKLYNASDEEVASGQVDPANPTILSWNTKTTNYNDYKLWYECLETEVEHVVCHPTKIYFNISARSRVAVAWMPLNEANAMEVGEATSLSYTHAYDSQSIGGEVQNPDAQYFNNSFVIAIISDNYYADWTLTLKNGSLLASGTVTQADGEALLGPWNTSEYDLDGATLTVTTAIDPGDYYFIVKANPEHITSIMGGPWKFSGQTYDDTVCYSLEGEYNILSSSGDYMLKIVGDENVEYNINPYKQDGTAGSSMTNKSGTYTYTVGTTYNKGVIEIESYKLLTGGPWSYTVIANPDHVNVRDTSNDNAAVTCLTGAGSVYETSANYTTPQIQTRVDNLSWSAYFYKAGADITDHSQALAKIENHVEATAQEASDGWFTAVGKTFSNSIYNGGTLVIESAVGVGSGSITITINANNGTVVKDKLKAMNYNKEITDLVKGTQTKSISSRYVTFYNTTDGEQFYHVYYNGDLKEPTAEAGEGGGSVTYKYSFSQVANGDEFVIDIDYPRNPDRTDGKWPVSIVVPEGCESFVQSLIVEGAEYNSWTLGTPIYVEPGKVVSVTGDTYNYALTQTIIDGEASAIASASCTKIIAGTSTIEFVVTPIVRDKSFTFISSDFASVFMQTAQGSKLFLPECDVTRTTVGSTVTKETCADVATQVIFNDDDNPIRFSANCTRQTSDETDYSCCWFVDGVQVAYNTNVLNRSVEEGQTIMAKWVAESEVVKGYNVNFQLAGGIETMPAVTYTTTAGSLPITTAGVSNLPENATVSIADNEYVEVTGVTLGGEALTPTDGVYSFTVTGACTVVITGNVKTERASFTINVTGDGSGLFAHDEDEWVMYPFATGENTIYLDEVTGPINIGMYNNVQEITAITKNDIDLSGTFSEDYHTYTFTPEDGDVINVTVETIVRDLTLTLHVTYLTNKQKLRVIYGETDLIVGELQEGENTVKFRTKDLPLFVDAASLNGVLPVVVLSHTDGAGTTTTTNYSYNKGYYVDCVDGDVLNVTFPTEVCDDVTIGVNGLVTYVGSHDIDLDSFAFADLKAYVATLFDPAQNILTLVRVTDRVPAGTGLLLKGEKKKLEHVMYATASSVSTGAPARRVASYLLSSNLLEGVYTGETVPASDGTTDTYALDPDTPEGFEKTTASSVSATNQAVLRVSASASNPSSIAKNAYSDGGTVELETIQVKLERTPEGIYTIGGLLLNTPESELAPGVYVIDGQKRVVK